MKKILFMLCLIIGLGGCATSPKVELLVDNFKGESKEFVLLSNDIHLRKLRVALRKRGFKVKKFSLYANEIVTKTVNTDDGTTSHTVAGNRFTAKYGIDVTDVELLDWCIGGEAKKINITLEITDLESGEVIAYVTNGGWDANCALFSGKLYDNIAKQISGIWKNKYTAIDIDDDDDED